MRVVMGFALLFWVGAAYAAHHDADSIILICWEGHDHAGMSECVADQAKSSLLDLTITESEVRKALAKSRNGEGFSDYQKEVAAQFEASSSIFRQYRSEHCAFLASVASQGNGSEDIRKACEASLNTDRADQLKTAKWWLSNRGDK